MLTNTKIFVRLAVLVAALLALMAAVAVVGIVGLSDMKNGLQTVYLDRVVPFKDLSKITDSYYRVRILVIETVNATRCRRHRQEQEAALMNSSPTRESSGTPISKSNLTPDEKALAGEAGPGDQATMTSVRERVLGTPALRRFRRRQGTRQERRRAGLAAVMGKMRGAHRAAGSRGGRGIQQGARQLLVRSHAADRRACRSRRWSVRALPF